MPTSLRVICGITRPTKPIGPARATAEPLRISTVKPDNTRTRFKLLPRPIATSSPKLKSVTDLDTYMAIRIPMSVQGNTSNTCSIRIPLIPPAVQKLNSCATWKYTTSICVTATNTALIAVPASARYTGVALPPTRLARAKMNSVANAAPPKENKILPFKVK